MAVQSIEEVEKIRTPELILQSRQIAAYTKKHSLLKEKPDTFQYGISRILAPLPTTDTGNAIRFVARYGEVVRFVPEKDAWYVWTGQHWQEDERGYVMEMVRKMLAYIDIEAVLLPPPMDTDGQPLVLPQIALNDTPTPEQVLIIQRFEAYEKQVENLRRWAKTSQSRKCIDAMLWLVRQEYGVATSILDFDANPLLFNCLNGTFNLQTGQLQPHNPADLISKIAGATYDPTAKAESWCKFMAKVMRSDAESLRTIQQISGEGLAGLQPDDVFPVNFGPGSNGKTVYSEVLKEVMGDYADTAPSDLFLAKQNEGISNDKAALVGVRFLTVSETDEGKRLNESLVKGMTGGDTQKVRFLRQEFFRMTPIFTGMLFTNHKPIITGTDNGIWRRVKMIPWLHNFENDPEREDKPVVRERMRTELSGILNWLIAGYQDRMKLGKLYISPRILEETITYRYNSDTLGEFLEDYCITTEEGAHVTKKDLYEKYKEFAVNAGQTNLATERGLSMRLRERTDIPFLGETRLHGGVRAWTGIRLRTEYDPEPTPRKPATITPISSAPAETVHQDSPATKEPISAHQGNDPTRDEVFISEETEQASQRYNAAVDLLGKLASSGYKLEFLSGGKRNLKRVSDSTPVLAKQSLNALRGEVIRLDTELREILAANETKTETAVPGATMLPEPIDEARALLAARANAMRPALVHYYTGIAVDGYTYGDILRQVDELLVQSELSLEQGAWIEQTLQYFEAVCPTWDLPSGRVTVARQPTNHDASSIAVSAPVGENADF